MEVLVDERGGESSRREIEGKCAAFSDAGQGFAAVLEEILGDALLVDLLDGGRGEINEMGEIEIANGDDEGEVARQEGGRGGEEVRGCELINNIGQEQDERPSWIDL